MVTQSLYTHEDFVHDVLELVRARLSQDDRKALAGVKLVYGAGKPSTRGVTYYNAWGAPGSTDKRPLIEICAFCERDRVQVAGTTIHEIGHVLAGWDAAHGKVWKDACERAGLRRIKAAGTNYVMMMIEPGLRRAITALPEINDGTPESAQAAGIGPRGGLSGGGCSAGQGTRGGTSRGAGSGSRMIKMWCNDCGYICRASATAIATHGPVHCPAHGAMEVAGATAAAADCCH